MDIIFYGRLMAKPRCMVYAGKVIHRLWQANSSNAGKKVNNIVFFLNIFAYDYGKRSEIDTNVC